MGREQSLKVLVVADHILEQDSPMCVRLEVVEPYACHEQILKNSFSAPRI